ncbi:hypothetical protein EGW08_008560 [Elysia chlorotica]|uniref:Uncharacterized protein n=1 Tax=Elysia chlorotica TaxID=188477 RepID=A0A433TQ06_ELYCH|nr:hypothetical protein EGW08_008560 [Elysia chlorotica]
MTEPPKEGPSNRALRQLNNRNNLADLKLRKTLEQFDRESFLGSPSARRHRSQTARTAPGRMRTAADYDGLDSDDESTGSDGYGGQRERYDVMSVPATRGTRLLTARQTTRPRVMDDFQRAEKFLRRLREEVARQELEAHYTDADHGDFLAAVLNNMHRPVTPSVNTPSDVTAVDRPESSKPVDPRRASTAKVKDEGQGRFDMVYPIRLLANIHTQNDPMRRSPTPSPSLGSGSPRVRATPLGIPEGGALGMGARLIMTAPQPLKPWTMMTTMSLGQGLCGGPAGAKGGGGFPAIARSDGGRAAMRSMLRSGFKRKPLEERVKDFCKELDDIRSRRVPC